MKTAQLTDEQYQHLVGLGIIKEETNDPIPIEEGIEPFVGIKYVRINKNNTGLIVGDVLPVTYYGLDYYAYMVGDNVRYIHRSDCTEVEAPVKELKPWEKYPTLESCWERGESRLNIDQDGKIFDSYGEYNYSTEAEAKRARATIKLSRIARKWNEGVEKKEEIYFVSISNGNDFYVDIWDADGSVSKMIPFYFYTKELLEKSLELFEQDWKDFYGK